MTDRPETRDLGPLITRISPVIPFRVLSVDVEGMVAGRLSPAPA